MSIPQDAATRPCCMCREPIGDTGAQVYLTRRRVTPGGSASLGPAQDLRYCCAGCSPKLVVTWPGQPSYMQRSSWFTCVYCGQQRKKSNTRQKYCNPACQRKYYSEQKRKSASLDLFKVCASPECELPVSPFGTKLYCSGYCRTRAQRLRRGPSQWARAKTCVCGKEIPPDRGGRKYCSTTCRSRADRARKKARLERGT